MIVLTDLAAIVRELEHEYPQTPSLLDYRTPFQLMVAVALSAQTTDAQVNRVTPQLFARFPTAADLAAAPLDQVTEIIRSIGFFRRKAEHIIAAAAIVDREYNGQPPDTMEALVQLPGIGRKSAGVILAQVYAQPAIIVDTHFGRVARRLGATAADDPQKVERDVAAKLDRDLWIACSMRLNYHGRRYCHARKPNCTDCPIRQHCPSRDSFSSPNRSSTGT